MSATNILTYLGDLGGTGANTNETTLTPANVNSSQFGKFFTDSVDGLIIAEPLYMAGVNITTGANQGIHNVVFVATAMTACMPSTPTTVVKLWQTSFINNTAPACWTSIRISLANIVISSVLSSDVNSTDISPEFGVVSTPVIDPATGTIYAVAKTKEIINGNRHAPDFFYQLICAEHPERPIQTSLGGGVTRWATPFIAAETTPTTRTISVADRADMEPASPIGGIIKFNTLRAMNRPGLTLYNGQIYIAFASHGDNDAYHGWVLWLQRQQICNSREFFAPLPTQRRRHLAKRRTDRNRSCRGLVFRDRQRRLRRRHAQRQHSSMLKVFPSAAITAIAS